MKVKELLDLLKTNYIVIADSDNEYNVNYLTKKEINPAILEQPVASIEPITFLRKQLFDENAEEGDYVSAIKFLYAANGQAAVQEEKIKEEPKQERPHQAFGGFGMPPFLDGVDLFGSLLTPEVIEQITKSDLFQSMLDPENIQEIINSDDFKDFMNNADFGRFSQGFDFLKDLQKGPFGEYPNPTEEDLEEYEEYEDYEENLDDYDDDEYEDL